MRDLARFAAMGLYLFDLFLLRLVGAGAMAVSSTGAVLALRMTPGILSIAAVGVVASGLWSYGALQRPVPARVKPATWFAAGSMLVWFLLLLV
ncbi:MAG TPA: hypothetical protein VF752_13755 [Thermoleophilaceae bacterium]